MARQFSLPYQIPPTALLAAAADAAGRISGYVSLKGALKAWIVCEVNQGHAEQVTFTPLQASDVAGTGSKAIAVTPIWANQDTATVAAPGAKQADAASFQASATLKDKLVIFEITPEQALDVTGGFDCIAIETSASHAANITRAEIFILGAYQQASPPSPLAN